MRMIVSIMLAVWMMASVAAADTITFDWNLVTTDAKGQPDNGVAGYKLYQSTVSGQYGSTPAKTIAGWSTSSTSLDVANGPTDQRYFWRLGAYDVAGNNSGLSNEVSKLIAASTSPAPTPTPTTDPISQLYVDVLGRQPDAAGLANWQSIYSSGSMTLAQIRAAFASSTESQGSIAKAYQAALNRQPTTQELTDAITFLSGSGTLAQLNATLARPAPAPAPAPDPSPAPTPSPAPAPEPTVDERVGDLELKVADLETALAKAQTDAATGQANLFAIIASLQSSLTAEITARQADTAKLQAMKDAVCKLSTSSSLRNALRTALGAAGCVK